MGGDLMVRGTSICQWPTKRLAVGLVATGVFTAVAATATAYGYGNVSWLANSHPNVGALVKAITNYLTGNSDEVSLNDYKTAWDTLRSSIKPLADPIANRTSMRSELEKVVSDLRAFDLTKTMFQALSKKTQEIWNNSAIRDQLPVILAPLNISSENILASSGELTGWINEVVQCNLGKRESKEDFRNNEIKLDGCLIKSADLRERSGECKDLEALKQENIQLRAQNSDLRVSVAELRGSVEYCRKKQQESSWW